MRILLDYRPALRARSGVGEYVHQLARHLASTSAGDSLTVFTSSWKDRPSPNLGSTLPGVNVSDHRIPGMLLNFAWHNGGWPPIELVSGHDFDVVLSSHPLLMPTRRAAQLVTIHDIDFFHHPERTEREIRRDYARLAVAHAQRADGIIVPSRYTAGEVSRVLGVPQDRIALCPPGVPDWSQPVRRVPPEGGYVLFMGTLEPRKNVGLLLAAYQQLLSRGATVPKLKLAGTPGSDAAEWLASIARPPLAGWVEHIGYVTEQNRQQVYSGARMLVLPSFNEGFGMPALEAMSLGIPVVVSDRGALPEVTGDAALTVSPDSVDALAAAIARLLTDADLATRLSERGRARAARFSWNETARAARAAFERAIRNRAHRN